MHLLRFKPSLNIHLNIYSAVVSIPKVVCGHEHPRPDFVCLRKNINSTSKDKSAEF